MKGDTASRGPVWASAPTEPPQLLRGWGIQHCVSVLPLASAGEHYGYGKAAGAEGQQQKHRHQREGIRGVRDGCRALGGSLCGRAGLLPGRCLRRGGDGAAFRLRRFLRQRLHCLCGGGSLLRHNGHTAKAGAKAQRRQQCAEKRSPIPTEPGWLLVSFFIVTLPFERGHTQCALFAICQLQYSTPVLAKPLQISAFGAIFSKFFIFFQRQQTRFFVNTARVACQAAVCADNTVAGYDEGNRVVPDRAAHGLRGHFGKAAFRRQPGGQCTVGCGLPIRNLTQQRPYLLPEGRAAGVQRRGEIRLLPVEVDIQPAFCLQKGRCSFGPVRRVQPCRKVFCAVKPQPGQTNFIRRQQDAAQGEIIMLCVLHRFHLTD